MKNLFCELLGHDWLYVGKYEKVCIKCGKADSDYNTDGLPIEAIHKYHESILLEFVRLEIDLMWGSFLSSLGRDGK